MKIYFYQNNKKNITSYTHELLKHLAIKNGHEVVSSPDIADISGISLTSFYEIDELRKFRAKNKEGLIVAGGHACNNPSALLRYADFVCLGQGFQFFSECGSVSDMFEKPYIIHKKKIAGEYSDFIDWGLIPCVKIGKNSYSYLYSMGCRNKCKFCLTSWANKYQANPNKAGIKKLKDRIGSKQFYLITNDFDSGVNVNRSVSDVRVKEYLSSPEKFDGIKLLRLGVESPSEKTRSWLSKPIKTDHLKDFFRLTKERRQRVNIFMIAGFDSQEKWEWFADIFDQDYEATPKIGVVMNYFDPSKLTPLENYDLRKIISLNIPRIKRIWRTKNVRPVIFMDFSLYPYSALIDAMFNRANWYDVDKIMEMRKKEKFITGKIKERKDKGLPYFFDAVQRHGLEHLLDGSSPNECEVKTCYWR
jgi:radical SAM superfamily enzyme YgiQ (UPF0313 family)